MDIPEENVADIKNYAFLLGSALRNNDTDHFFCIYDSIIPADLPEVQVETIKDHARFIADLPEDAFNELVLNARDYSLARCRSQFGFNPAMAMNSSSRILIGPCDDGDDYGPGLHHSENLLKLELRSIGQRGYPAAAMADNDSGVPSSMRTGQGPPSTSSLDEEKEMEERGVFDYVPAKLGKEKRGRAEEVKELAIRLKTTEPHVVVNRIYNPQFDEIVPVENDNESIESPRSDTSSMREYDLKCSVDDGTEMNTYRTEHTSYIDEDKSSDEDHVLNLHKSLYSRTERPRASSTSSIDFPRSQQIIGKGQTISSLRSSSTPKAVDDGIKFGLRANGPTRCSPDYTLESSSPPFGSGEDLLARVGNSVSNIFSQNKHPMVAGMSDRLSVTLDGKGKKKKQKKKDSKDESSREGAGCGGLMKKDINGNPYPSIDIKNYHQMRRPAHESVASKQSPGGSASNNELDMGTKTDDTVSPPGASANGVGKSRKSRKSARKPGIDVRPENEPDYVGNIENVETLSLFIENRVSRESLHKSAAASAAPPSSKSLGKKKDKNKSRQLQTTGDGENCIEDSLSPASETTKLLSSSKASTYHSCDGPAPLDKTESLALQDDNMGTNQSIFSSKLEDDPCEIFDHGVQENCSVTQMKPISHNKADIDSCKLSNGKLPSGPKRELIVGNGEAKSVQDSAVKFGKSGNLKDKFDTSQLNVDIDVPEINNKKNKWKQSKVDTKLERNSQKLIENGEYGPDKDTKKSKAVGKDSELSPAAPCTSDHLLANKESDQFQFTDFNPKLELPSDTSDFQPVKSKRSAKKKSPQTNSVPTYSQPFCPLNNNKNFFSSSTQYNRGMERGGSYGWQQQGGDTAYVRQGSALKPRSFTPPPNSRRTANGEINGKDTDPLSPSAFPDLPSHNHQRRRSLEGVSLDTGQLLPSDKDSDKESCKSLPADKGLTGRTEGVWCGSARHALAISYAHMASVAKSPRQSLDSSKAESIASGSDDHPEFTSPPASATTPLKWKGSPQERRHSIGSAPEELSKMLTGGILQRSGSQELLPRDADLEKAKAASVSITSSDSAGSFVGSSADSARGSELGLEADVFPCLPVAGTHDRGKLISVEDRKAKSQEASVVRTIIPEVSAAMKTVNIIVSGSTSKPASEAVSGSTSTPASESVCVSGSTSKPAPEVVGVSGSTSTPASEVVCVSGSTSKPASEVACVKTVSCNIAHTLSRSQDVGVNKIVKTDSLIKTTSNGLKNVKRGGVEFLDSKKDVPLDISFFYNPNGSEAVDTLIAAEVLQPIEIPDLSASTTPLQLISDNVEVSHRNVGVTASIATLPPPCSSDSKSSKPQKGPHISGLNGIVQQPACSDVQNLQLSCPSLAFPTAESFPPLTASKVPGVHCAADSPQPSDLKDATLATNSLPEGATRVLVGGKVNLEGFKPFTLIVMSHPLPAPSQPQMSESITFLTSRWAEHKEYLDLSI